MGTWDEKPRYATVMTAFRGELAPGLRAVQMPRMSYGPFVRALSPAMADLWYAPPHETAPCTLDPLLATFDQLSLLVEKIEMGIDAWDPIYDGDIEAVMSGLSAALYSPYTALRCGPLHPFRCPQSPESYFIRSSLDCPSLGKGWQLLAPKAPILHLPSLAPSYVQTFISGC
eukprot:7013140-Pyramimonas_sp.AAC.2